MDPLCNNGSHVFHVWIYPAVRKDVLHHVLLNASSCALCIHWSHPVILAATLPVGPSPEVCSKGDTLDPRPPKLLIHKIDQEGQRISSLDTNGSFVQQWIQVVMDGAPRPL